MISLYAEMRRLDRIEEAKKQRREELQRYTDAVTHDYLIECQTSPDDPFPGLENR